MKWISCLFGVFERITEFASGLKEPRVVRVAPNGDIFVAESGAGRVTVLTAADGAPKAVNEWEREVFLMPLGSVAISQAWRYA